MTSMTDLVTVPALGSLANLFNGDAVPVGATGLPTIASIDWDIEPFPVSTTKFLVLPELQGLLEGALLLKDRGQNLSRLLLVQKILVVHSQALLKSTK